MACSNWRHHPNWCKEDKKYLSRTFAEKLDKDEKTGDFFGDWTSFEGHSDTGYFLGGTIINELSEEYSLEELANLDLNVIENKLKG